MSNKSWKVPIYRIKAEVELEVWENDNGFPSTLYLSTHPGKLKGEFIEVKSGDFENAMTGYITKVLSSKKTVTKITTDSCPGCNGEGDESCGVCKGRQ